MSYSSCKSIERLPTQFPSRKQNKRNFRYTKIAGLCSRNRVVTAGTCPRSFQCTTLLVDLFALSSVDHYVFIGFKYFHFIEQTRIRELGRQRIPDEYGHVLSCADQIVEVRDIFVQILVIHHLHDTLFHVNLQVRQIHHHSSFMIDGTPDGDFNYRKKKYRLVVYFFDLLYLEMYLCSCAHDHLDCCIWKISLDFLHLSTTD